MTLVFGTVFACTPSATVMAQRPALVRADVPRAADGRPDTIN